MVHRDAIPHPNPGWESNGTKEYAGSGYVPHQGGRRRPPADRPCTALLCCMPGCLENLLHGESHEYRGSVGMAWVGERGAGRGSSSSTGAGNVAAQEGKTRSGERKEGEAAGCWALARSHPGLGARVAHAVQQLLLGAGGLRLEVVPPRGCATGAGGRGRGRVRQGCGDAGRGAALAAACTLGSARTPHRTPHPSLHRRQPSAAAAAAAHH